MKYDQLSSEEKNAIQFAVGCLREDKWGDDVDWATLILVIDTLLEDSIPNFHEE